MKRCSQRALILLSSEVLVHKEPSDPIEAVLVVEKKGGDDVRMGADFLGGNQQASTWYA